MTSVAPQASATIQRAIRHRHEEHVRQAGKIGVRLKIFRIDHPINRDRFSLIAQAFFVWNDETHQVLSGDPQLEFVSRRFECGPLLNRGSDDGVPHIRGALVIRRKRVRIDAGRYACVRVAVPHHGEVEVALRRMREHCRRTLERRARLGRVKLRPANDPSAGVLPRISGQAVAGIVSTTSVRLSPGLKSTLFDVSFAPGPMLR